MKLGVTLDILNQKDTPAFYADTLANRPAAGFTGRVFISTDTLDLYRDTGTTWVLLSPSSTGTITGSGAAGQVTFFSSASSITGTNDLFYDSGNNRLGINTNAPTAPLDVHSSLSGALLQLNQTSGTFDSQIAFQSANVGKWRIGSYYNAGQYSFGIYDVFNSRERFSVLNTGQTFVGDQVSSSGKLVVNSGSLGDTGLVVISSSSPSIRINNGGTGANFRCGLGISTATNNFIQGSADGDFCIFNSNTGTYPILFGINDTGLGNTQEAARISAARNFLVGTSVDAGQKLQVSGTALISGAITSSGITSTGTNTMLSASSSTEGLVIRGGSSVGSPSLASGQILIGQTPTYRGSISYDDNAGYLYIDNIYNNNSGNIYIRTKTGGTPINALAISGNGTATFSGLVNAEQIRLITAPTNALLITPTLDTNASILNVTNASQSVNWLSVGTGGKVIMNGTGNVLIGKETDAGQKLQVDGNTFFDARSSGYASHIRNINDSSEGLLIQSTDNDTSLYLLRLQSSVGATSQSWQDRFLVSKGGDVQIGLDSNPFLNIANGGSANVTSGISWLYGSGLVNGGGIEMAAPSGNSFYMIFKTRNAGSTAERMRIKENGVINLTSIPTSAVGLSSGDIYSNAGILTIVP